MFRGKFETTIDAKGRTSIPAKFREVLVESFGDERFFLTKSSPVRLGEGRVCYGLVIYPYQDFLALEAKLKEERDQLYSNLTPWQRVQIAPP